MGWPIRSSANTQPALHTSVGEKIYIDKWIRIMFRFPPTLKSQQTTIVTNDERSYQSWLYNLLLQRLAQVHGSTVNRCRIHWVHPQQGVWRFRSHRVSEHLTEGPITSSEALCLGDRFPMSECTPDFGIVDTCTTVKQSYLGRVVVKIIALAQQFPIPLTLI